MPQTIEVALGSYAYPVEIGTGLLDLAGSRLAGKFAGHRPALITDSNVAPLYADRLTSSLRAQGFDPVLAVVPAGEQSKSLEQAGILCDELIAAGLDRSAFVIALGGGVIGDLAGFVAAIYLRGIPFVQIPTTVVAQVDSAVGGKTGVNARAGKNLIGAFHQPALVLADVDTLDTLPEREFHEGFAEIIKHGVIRDADLLRSLVSFRRDDQSALEDLIARNVAIKAHIVAEDERETTGLRALLNFGHTLGHGIENAAGYGRLLHGEAISLGIVAATRLSQKLAGLPQADADAIFSTLKRFHLPTRLPDDIPTPQILAAMASDKKFAAGKIRFVLTPHPGAAFVSDKVTLEALGNEIEALRHE